MPSSPTNPAEFWATKSNREVAKAAANLGDYTAQHRSAIQAELDRRGLIGPSGAPAAQATESPTLGSKHVSGIGGWLLLPAIGIPIAALQSLRQLLTARTDLQGVLALVSLLLLIALAAFFYTKHAWTPYVMIAFLVIQLVLPVVAAGLVGLAASNSSAPAPGAGAVGGAVGRAMAQCAVWIPYFLVSRRVKATFTPKATSST